MKIKTSEASGATLDWMVAKCEGVYLAEPVPLDSGCTPFQPSTNWSQGGPIIEGEKVDLMSYLERADLNMSWRWRSCMMGTKAYYGPTPLVAAMRCYVASKLGDEVEVPSALLT